MATDKSRSTPIISGATEEYTSTLFSSAAVVDCGGQCIYPFHRGFMLRMAAFFLCLFGMWSPVRKQRQYKSYK
jgi:hypothetical protein